MDNSKNQLKNFLLDLLFPKFCLSCKKEGFYLCEDCRSILDIAQFNYCLCDKSQIKIMPQQKSGKCKRCENKNLSGLYFALPYKEKHLTRKLIYQFKYEPYLKDLAKTLASIIAEHLILAQNNQEEIWHNSVLIPVPVDMKKMKTRGYNQSEELAKELSFIIKVPAIFDVLVKTKVTRPQMELSKYERKTNLDGAFEIKNPEQIQDKKIFLVDDVYTTGSTMEECAKVFKKQGAVAVWGICLARESLMD